MCGIAGVLYFDKSVGSGQVGQSLLTMSQCLQHRGADSAGVAVFSQSSSKTTVQVVVPKATSLPEPQMIVNLTKGALSSLRETADGFAATLTDSFLSPSSTASVVSSLETGLPGCTVTAVGNSLSICKTVGVVDSLASQITPLTGTHGIAHLRLATESRIDPAHAQPFWGRPFADIAVTHNGHITNYYKLRQKLEARGLTFASQNDSEIIGILIGEKLADGKDLNGALESIIPDLDGSYSFIVATSTGLGVARDPFATKPLLFVETDGVLAIASEQQALRRLLGDSVTIHEIQPREYRTWEKA